MIFELSCWAIDVGAGGGELWTWTLKAADRDVCRSVTYFHTERAARSDIAAAKTSMKGAKFAKVADAGECG